MTAESPRWATRGWWLAASFVLAVGLLVTIFLGLTSKPAYVASTTSFVAMGRGSAAESDPFAGSPFVLQRMSTYADLATSPQVLQPVIDELRLPLTPEALAARVTATNPPSTVLLTVQVRDDDGERAGRIAAALAVQQARVVERLEAAGGASQQAPVRVTVVDRATSRPASSLLWYLAIAGEAAATAVLVLAALALRRRQLEGLPGSGRAPGRGAPRRARRGKPEPLDDAAAPAAPAEPEPEREPEREPEPEPEPEREPEREPEPEREVEATRAP